MDLSGITLPDELGWPDEFDWSPAVQSIAYGVTGALFIQKGEKAAGRDITLTGTAELGWITRETVALLQASRDADVEVTLTLPDARTFTVRWKLTDKCLDVEPIIAHNQYASGQYYKVNALKFFQVPSP